MTKGKAKRAALGRGLGALLPPQASDPPNGSTPRPSAKAPTPPDPGPRAGSQTLPIEQIAPNPEQPRRYFDPVKLEELAASIRAQGILQPIVVSPPPQPSGPGPQTYLIVAGERRWRASQRAGLHEVPVVIRAVDAEDRLELALVENIQRADLNPIEEAQAYADLIELRAYTQDELAMRMGKDRSTIANAVRLLKLPSKVQTLVQTGRLGMGHARALLGLERQEDMSALAAEVVHANLSVRATEAAVRKQKVEAAEPAVPSDEEARRQIIVGELETRLRRRLGARVRLRSRGTKGSGTIEIPYTNLDELDRLLKLILSDA